MLSGLDAHNRLNFFCDDF